MGNLIFIRHSLPQFSEVQPPEHWELSQKGLARCEWLAKLLRPYHPKTLVHSREVKAQQTAEVTARLLSCNWMSWPNLHEHVRPASYFTDQVTFESRVKAFFEHPGELVFGLETADEAYTRFTAAVETLRAHTFLPAENLFIVSHGTVISLFVAQRCGIDAFSLWKQLKLPSYIVLSGQDNTLLDIMTPPMA